MQPEAAPETRARCPACRLATSACWCAHVPVLAPRSRVIVLQHPREARNPMGTARMAHLALPGSRLLIGVDFAADPRIAELLAAEPTSVVLYPDPSARPVAELAERAGALAIWVIDGTWSQAHKIWRKNPWLRALPAYGIAPEAPSRYLIRREPTPTCISSVEAVAAALDAAEAAPGRHAAMLRPLDVLVERQLGHARSARRAPRRRDRPERPLYLPAPLQGRTEHALLVHGEGNVWPMSLEARPPAELVHWVAMRPSTGERFAALVRPSAGVSPGTEQQLGLPAAAFADAISPAELRQRWAAFVRPDDVWCAWGHFPRRLLDEAGVPSAPIVELRGWAHRWLRARPGRLELAADQFAITASAPSPSSPGRGGRRLALLEAIFARLLTRPR